MARKSRKNTESVTAPVQESTFYATAIYVRLSIENSVRTMMAIPSQIRLAFVKTIWQSRQT